MPESFLYAHYNNSVRLEGVEVHGGALDVHTADVHQIPVNEQFHYHTGVDTTVATLAAVNTRDLDLVDSTGFVVGTQLQVNSGLDNPLLYTIRAKVGDVITLDGLLDSEVAVGFEVHQVVTDMAVIASAGAPLTYIVTPPVGEVWHITRFIITMTHTGAGDLGLFGNIAAVTNGMIVRGKVGGKYRSFTNWKTNANIKKDMYDVEFDTRSGGSGTHGTSGRGSFSRIGVAIRLDGSLGDELHIVLQDSYVLLDSLEVNGQGHIELPSDLI